VIGEIETNAGLGSRRFVSPPRKGFALAAALFTLLLISALATGVFFAVTEETWASSATAERQHALSAAESAVEMSIADSYAEWPASIGATVTRAAPIEDVGAPIVVHVTRLDSSVYWIVGVATVRSRGLGVSCRVGVAVRAATGSDHSITIDRISERSWSELF
jgi:Tfp pilus assembly protein PilX